MSDEGIYIYCITDSKGASERFGPIGIGDRGDEVYTVCFDGIAAVVSGTPVKKYAVARENLIPHEKAIETVMQNRTVLPVRFCTIAQDEQRVRKILEREHDRFFSLLREMDGKKELGLKAVFKEEALFRDILSGHDEIRTKKELMEKDPGSPRVRQGLMEIGRMVEAALLEEKEKYRQLVLSSLEPLSLKAKINNTYGERMIINAAFLVDRAAESLFDKRVSELDSRYGAKITFKYVGLLPPFNFVNVVIDTGGYA